jgi:RHS repeat-associated protein
MIDVDGGNIVYYYHFDGQASVAALSDVNNVIVERYSYDVFGAPTIYDVNSSEISQSAIGNPYMFTARRADDETALYYYRARYYAFDIGRFLQTDPIGYSDGLNLYVYCLNNPIRFKDPTGLISELGPIEKVQDNINRKYVFNKVKKAKLTIKTNDGKRRVITVASASQFQNVLRNINVSGNKIVEFRYVGHGFGGGIGLSLGTGEEGITTNEITLPGQIGLYSMKQLIQTTFDPQAKIELCGCFTAQKVGPAFKEMIPGSEVWGYENIGHVSVTLNLSWSEFRLWKKKSGWTEVKANEKGCEK